MPDLILSHASVHTLDRTDKRAEAVAIQDGRIVAVGTNDAVLALSRPETRVVRLDGATVLPGFNYAHCHIMGFGFDRAMVSLSTPPVKDIPDILRLLQERVDSLGGADHQWVLGRGYDQNKLVERRHPTRQELDTV